MSDDTPQGYRRPRAKNRVADFLMDLAFNFTGPAQASRDDSPPRGPRTEEEARSGFGEFERVSVDGKSYLVKRR
jgi:hypothetical protein